MKLPDSDFADLVESLTKLGIKSYDDYLKSDFWKQAKKRFAKSGLEDCCYACCHPVASLHHVRYSTLGREIVEKDIIPLCEPCHLEVHNLVNADKKYLLIDSKQIINVNLIPKNKAIRQQNRQVWFAFKEMTEPKKNRRKKSKTYKTPKPTQYGVDEKGIFHGSKQYYENGSYFRII